MDFVSNQKTQAAAMLKMLGIASVDELFKSIPKSLLNQAPGFDDGMSELEALQLLESLGNKNSYSNFTSYLGAGAYAHHVPVLVEAITSRSEFLTSYTPYQPEVSQGMLQAIFEYQSAIAALTCLDVSNASVYDGAAACAESILMALRLNKDRKTIAVSEGVHPSYLGLIKQYISGLDVNLHILPLEDLKTSCKNIPQDLACILIQSPNFFGCLEEMDKFKEAAVAGNALFIACGNPLSYALFKPPGEYGADIAVGDAQVFGSPLEFGGPYVGYMACKEEIMRQLPGRIVGQTVDRKGEKGFVLTLQAREQHIRREKATSNICTNQALAALASLVTMLWYGPIGLKKLALTNFQRAHYLAEKLNAMPGFSVFSPFFNEFTLKIPCSTEKALARFKDEKIIPGLALNRFFPHLKEHLLVSVTELKTEESLNHFIEVAKTL